MAGRQRATFQKRQKEIKRLEKQREKAAKRAAHRLEKSQRHSQNRQSPQPFPEDRDVSLTSDISDPV